MDKKNTLLNLKDKILKSKKARIIIAVLLCVLLFLIVFFRNFSAKSTAENTYSDYVTSLEVKLSETLSSVKGAGKVSVVITVESGMETVLAMKTTITETSKGKETVKTPILVNGKTVVLKEMYPKITGVLIVCEGASSISVMNKIEQATVSLLDVNVNQIQILTMK